MLAAKHFFRTVLSPVLLLFYSALNTGRGVFPGNANKTMLIKHGRLLPVLVPIWMLMYSFAFPPLGSS